MLLIVSCKEPNEDIAVRKKRLSWEDRHRQLISVALDFVRSEGADSLTLTKVAEQAGVTKPVAYDHFKTREGLLIELCAEFDEQQRAELKRLEEDGTASLPELARAVARSYMDCYSKTEGEWHTIYSVMRSSPEMAKIHQQLFNKHIDVLVSIFRPKTDMEEQELRLTCIGLMGAGETISAAMMQGVSSKETAIDVMADMFISTLGSPPIP
jgi:AcrR family transcriptional regulator